jgi:multisubunit Na+/H+ antiporter MnhC subunit
MIAEIASVVLVASTIASVESRKFIHSIGFLAVHGFIASTILGYLGLYESAIITAITFGILIPAIFLLTVKHIHMIRETEHSVTRITSLIIIILINIIVFSLMSWLRVQFMQIISIAIFATGVYALLEKRNLMKIVLGLAITENALHFYSAIITPFGISASMISIVASLASVITTALALYISLLILKVIGTSDSRRLKELKW